MTFSLKQPSIFGAHTEPKPLFKILIEPMGFQGENQWTKTTWTLCLFYIGFIKISKFLQTLPEAPFISGEAPCLHPVVGCPGLINILKQSILYECKAINCIISSVFTPGPSQTCFQT